MIEVMHSSNWYDCNIDYLEIQSLNPKIAPIPITDTGFKSHFLNEKHIIKAGGAVAFVEAWLETEAQSPTWKSAEPNARQLSLF